MENIQIIIKNLKRDISSNEEIYLDSKLYIGSAISEQSMEKLHYGHSRFRIITFDTFVSLGEFVPRLGRW